VFATSGAWGYCNPLNFRVPRRGLHGGDGGQVVDLLSPGSGPFTARLATSLLWNLGDVQELWQVAFNAAYGRVEMVFQVLGRRFVGGGLAVRSRRRAVAPVVEEYGNSPKPSWALLLPRSINGKRRSW
jgi:hypothetical protein